MTRVLMRAGADARQGNLPASQRDEGRCTIASDRGYAELVAIIDEEEGKRRGVPSSAPDELCRGDRERRDDRAIAMMEGDALLNPRPQSQGLDAVHVASFAGNERLAEWLATHGAD